jgi:threonine synthase
MAGYLAREMGAPIDRLILATNENDILSRFFNTGEYSQGDVAKTLSPSMDIQVASNFERYLFYCVGRDPGRVRELMAAFKQYGAIRFDSLETANPGGVFVAGRGSNAETRETIAEVFEQHGYVLDPHTAVGVHVGRQFRRDGVPCVCLSTAHPAKFLDAVAEATGRDDVGHHPSIDALSGLEARCEVLPADREAIRAYIVDKLG